MDRELENELLSGSEYSCCMLVSPGAQFAEVGT